LKLVLEELTRKCVVLRSSKLLRLPVFGRDETLLKRLRQAPGIVKCGEERYYVLIVLCQGFPARLLICLARDYEVTLKRYYARDELSGLTIRLFKPELSLDSCSVELEWERTRFKLDCSRLQNCSGCVEASVTLLDRLYRSRLL
jgi:hypothetical protein